MLPGCPVSRPLLTLVLVLLPRLLYPEQVDHIAANGGRHHFIAKTCSVVEESDPTQFTGPEYVVLPSDTRFDPSQDSTVKVVAHCYCTDSDFPVIVVA